MGSKVIYRFIFLILSICSSVLAQDSSGVLSDKKAADIYKLVNSDEMEIIKTRYSEFMDKNKIQSEEDLVVAIERMSSIDCELSDVYYCKLGDTKRSIKDAQNPIHNFIFYLYLIIPDSGFDNLDALMLDVYNGDKFSLRSLSFLQGRFSNEFAKELKAAKSLDEKKMIAQKVYRFLEVYFSTPKSSGAYTFCEESNSVLDERDLNSEKLKKIVFKDIKKRDFTLNDVLKNGLFFEMNESTEKDITEKIKKEFDELVPELYKADKTLTFTSLSIGRSQKMIENKDRESITIGPDNFVQLFDDNQFFMKSSAQANEFREKITSKIKEGYEIIGVNIESSSNILRNTSSDYSELVFQGICKESLRFKDGDKYLEDYYPRVFSEIINNPKTTWPGIDGHYSKKWFLNQLMGCRRNDHITFTGKRYGISSELSFKQLSFFRAVSMTSLLPLDSLKSLTSENFIFNFLGTNGDGSSGSAPTPENKFARISVKLRLNAGAPGAQVKATGFSTTLKTIKTKCYHYSQCVPGFRFPQINFPSINLPNIDLSFLLPSFGGGFRGARAGSNRRFSKCFFK